MRKLKAYFVGPKDWTLLVFHYTAAKAIVLGWKESPCVDTEYIDYRVRLADQKYLAFARGHGPHVVDCPPPHCAGETWIKSLDLLLQSTQRG